ncbi:MAG: ammonia channel protein, partial [Comamonas sp.]
LAMVVTHLAAAGGAIGWAAGEWMFRRRVSLLGLCSGLVAGLVAVTPAAGFVDMGSGLLIGAIAGLVCYWGATGFKRWLGADDSLDVFGVHGLGGMVGSILTGVFVSSTISGASGNLLAQIVAVVAVAVYSFAATCVLMWLTDRVTPVRVELHDEQQGLDITQHREHVGQ